MTDVEARPWRRFGVLVWSATAGQWQAFTSRDVEQDAVTQAHLSRYRWLVPVCVMDNATGLVVWQSPGC